jgi:hypothetical protein
VIPTLQGVNADGHGATGPPLVDGAAYNEFWFERETLETIEGRKPTSLIVDPADGRIPAFTAGVPLFASCEPMAWESITSSCSHGAARPIPGASSRDR